MEKKTWLATLKALFAEASEPMMENKNETGTEPQANVWGRSGRQAQMQIRHLMQLKAFGRLK